MPASNSFRFMGICLIVLFLVLSPAGASADTVKLKDGKSLKGEVVGTVGGEIELKKGDGITVFIPMENVESVEQELSAEDYKSLKEAAKKAAETLRKGYKGNKGIAVAVVDIVPDDGPVTSTGEFISGEMANRLVGGPFKIIERKHLTQVLKEQALAQSGALDPEAELKAGKLAGAEAIVTGSFVLVGDTLFLNTRLVNVASGEVLAAGGAETKCMLLRNGTTGEEEEKPKVAAVTKTENPKEESVLAEPPSRQGNVKKPRRRGLLRKALQGGERVEGKAEADYREILMLLERSGSDVSDHPWLQKKLGDIRGHLESGRYRKAKKLSARILRKVKKKIKIDNRKGNNAEAKKAYKSLQRAMAKKGIDPRKDRKLRKLLRRSERMIRAGNGAGAMESIKMANVIVKNY